MTKRELRKIYRDKRLALTATERSKFDDLILIQFQRLSFEGVQCILSYWPMEERIEMNTHLYTRYLTHLIPGLQVCYPLVDFAEHTMTPILVEEETDFKQNAYGIFEPLNGVVINPQELDMIFVPLLAFDESGYRVGYGKGFYDRFLINCKPDVITAGFSYFDAVDKIDDTNQFDVPLSYCITPQKLYEF